MLPPDEVTLARLGEAKQRELADRLEHPEAVDAFSRHPTAVQALVEEGGERAEVRFADLFGCLERAAAAEDGQAAEESLLVAVEQVVRPADRRVERRVAWIGVTGRRELEPLGQPLEERRR